MPAVLASQDQELVADALRAPRTLGATPTSSHIDRIGTQRQPAPLDIRDEIRQAARPQPRHDPTYLTR
jgi:hypothetical protein